MNVAWGARMAVGLGAVALAIGAGGAIISGAAQRAPAAGAGAATVSAETAGATLAEYCLTCHNARVRSGELTLEGLSLDNVPAHAETWEKVVRKLRVGMMPPAGMPRPDEATYAGLIALLEQRLDAPAADRAMPGRRLLHRLNRAEYANAVRDLLGIDVDVASLLPPDDAAFGFDNVADALGSSPALLQAYLSAARKISAAAVGDVGTAPGSATYTVRQDLSQDHHLEGLPLGTVGGAVVHHTFPVDGEYEFQLRLYRTNLNAMRGIEDPHELELTLDGRRVLLAQLGGPADLVRLQKNPTAMSDEIEATRLRIRVAVEAGRRAVSAAFLDEVPSLLETNRLQRFIRDFASPYDAEGAPHVQSITINGPFRPQGAPQPAAAALFICRPASAKASAGQAAGDEVPCARRILAAVARRAYRRPLSAPEIDGLVSFYTQERARGTFESGIGFALRRVLTSPSFVFRVEGEPPDLEPGRAYAVNDFELATRLAFFLWSSIPDEELLRLAEAGRLHRPEVLTQQVRRMLAHDRASALVGNFAGQWLQLRNVRAIVPNSDLFPDYDDNLRQALRREAELFFASIIAEDRNVLDLLSGDYTFVNERLARHYGIEGVFGSSFRRVQVPSDARRGLLGKGAVLLVTSHANVTSPVLRGKWVLENLLGAPPPPPPPDVPALQEDDGVPRTMRQQMERHRSSPGCASCHRLMDPIGFALENFDAVGAWRTTDTTGAALDTTDVLASGEQVRGVAGLRAALLKRPEVFVQTFTEKLLVYALGRGLTHEDMPTVRRIVAGARAEGYRFSSLVLGIARSAPFQMRLTSAAGGSQVAAAAPAGAAAP